MRIMRIVGSKQLLVVVVVLLVAGFFVRAPLPVLLVAAEPIVPLGGFTITNTLIATWVTMIVLVLLFRAATTNMKLVPSGVQNVLETGAEALFKFVTSTAGEKNGRKFFPLIATIFFFVMANSWLSLLPGFGTIGLIHHAEGGHAAVPFAKVGPLAVLLPNAQPLREGEHAPEGFVDGVLVPVFRGANTDLNTTLAIAITAMLFVQIWGVQSNGMGYFGKFISLGKIMKGQVAFGLIDFFVGLIETVGEFARIISFSFRLFGNMFAGEVLLAVIVFLVPWILVLPFYGLELFVGIVQGLVFSGLTLVYATMAAAGHGGGHEEGHGHGAEAAHPGHH